MNIRTTFVKALLLGATILAASSVSQPVLAATLGAQQKGTLDGAASVGTAISQIIGTATTPADKADLARQIVAYLAGKPGITADRLKAVVRAAVQAAGAASAPSIATAAAQAVASSANAAVLVSAVATGAVQGGGVAADIQSTLSTALPAALQAAIAVGIAAASTPTQDVLPTGGNVKDNSVATPV